MKSPIATRRVEEVHHPATRQLGSLLLVVVGLVAGSAAEHSPDKSGYHLFNPTPRELMREMSTDRPDQTESAYTVDAGHFQVEMDLVTFTRDTHNPARDGSEFTQWSVAPMNLKVGLLNNVDLQLTIDPWVDQQLRNVPGGTTIGARGFGGLGSRLKVNLWGNDGGPTALSLMPFVSFPVGSEGLARNEVEAGIIAPFAVELPAGWGMTVMTEFDFLEDADGSGLHAEFVNSITFSHDLVGKLGGYVEFFTIVSTEDDSDGWAGFFDFGLTYAVTEDLQLDAGMNIGVTRAAPDWQPFVGLSWRF